MYVWIWRHLPGDGVTKVLVACVLVGVLIAVLWYVAFPRVESEIQFDRGVVEGERTSAPASPRP